MGRLTLLFSALFKRSFDKRFRMAKLTRVPLIGPVMEYAFSENDGMTVISWTRPSGASSRWWTWFPSERDQ